MHLDALGRRNLRGLGTIVAVSAALGAAYGVALAVAVYDTSPWRGIVQGGLTGSVISGWCGAFDLFLMRRRRLQWLGGLSFAPLIGIKTLYYLAGILLGLYGTEALFDGGGVSAGPREGIWASVALSFAIAFAVNFVLAVNRMLGQNVLGAFVSGRYHRPKTEERFFLFVDMVGSTAAAERIGHARFLGLLDRFVRVLTGPVLETGGEIYRYVGDEMIVSWPANTETAARSIACVLAMRERLDARAEDYRRAWDVVPRFRAALHAGPVVVGEMGDVRREIVFLGDTVNATARLEDLARDLGRDTLLSGEIAERAGTPAGARLEPLGRHALRGRAAPLEVFDLIPGAAGRD